MDYREFLTKYASESILPGDIVDEEGNILGKHEGLPFYTIGQKKKLRIANNPQYFVISKNISSNTLIVRNKNSSNPINFIVKNMNWLSPKQYENIFQCMVKIRYRSQEIPATVNIGSSDTVSVMVNYPHCCRNHSRPNCSFLY